MAYPLRHIESGRLSFFTSERQMRACKYIDKLLFTDSVFSNSCYRATVCLRGLCCRRVFPSVCLSVTSRHCTKMAKRITQITPDDSPGILVFWCQRSRRNSNWFTPNV